MPICQYAECCYAKCCLNSLRALEVITYVDFNVQTRSKYIFTAKQHKRFQMQQNFDLRSFKMVLNQHLIVSRDQCLKITEQMFKRVTCPCKVYCSILYNKTFYLPRARSRYHPFQRATVNSHKYLKCMSITLYISISSNSSC